MCLMLWLAITCTVLGPNRTSISYTGDAALRKAQIMCFFAGVAVDCVLDIAWGVPYRCTTSYFVMMILKLNVLSTCLYALLRGFDMTNSFLIDNKLSSYLNFQSLAVGILVLIALLFAVVRQEWPTTLHSLRHQIEDSEHVILAIRRSQALLGRCQLTAREFVDLEEVDEAISVHQEQMANCTSSMFHPTVREVLEQLVNLRKQAQSKSYMKLRSLRNSMATFRHKLDARDRALVFLPHSRKMILLKLLALRFLIGDRKFEQTIDF
eukprot:TRINITY_DN2541_c0_g1_i1.p1 TRINITY_DN2541_c0_g1~~TRINITY_DN2541_c0_g1_i1.p1  ORF type:complete len:266 (-),score=48.18 TRINITY_DN2541_c0_g1_i1:110-907(-)